MNIHFIAIEGIGVSALAELCISRGDRVTGSDLRPGSISAKLKSKGAGVVDGHAASFVSPDTELVVRSSCIKDTNPEVVAARELGIPVIYRGELLKKLLDSHRMPVGVTGTHGKTTTSSLVAHLLEKYGDDPTVALGGEVETFGGNAKLGRGGVMIAEVDESDGYFRNIDTKCAIVTNIEREHVENYTSFEDIIKAYEEYVARIPLDGILVYNGEDKLLTKVAKSAKSRKISFGIEGKLDVTCGAYDCSKGTDFELIIRGKNYGRVTGLLKGRYNMMNTLGALALLEGMGFDITRVIKSVSSFGGAKRRFETDGKAKGVEVIEDYAHHPTELRSVIGAAKAYASRRVIAVFQPHRYSRTQDLWKEFSECFYGADVLVLTDIYTADEDRIAGVSARNIYEAVDKSRFKNTAFLDKSEIPAFIAGTADEGDVVLLLGAGNIRDIAPDVLKFLNARKACGK